MWNKKLLILNGISILAVVFNHAAHRGFTSMFWWAHRFRPVVSPNFDQIGSLNYYGLSLVLELTIFSVPAFLFVGGFFVAYAARGSQSSLSWQVVLTRLRNILIPYLIWSFVIFITDSIQGAIYSPLEYVRRILIGDALEAYFFVPLLCQFYLLSPFIVRLAKKQWKLLLMGAALIQLGAQSLWYLRFVNVEVPLFQRMTNLPPWLFTNMLFFFVLGVVAGLYLQEFKDFLARFKWHLLAAVFVFASLSFIEFQLFTVSPDGRWLGDYRSITNNFYALAFIASYLAFDRLQLPFPNALIQLGTRSYGIYLIHIEVLAFMAKVLYHVAPWVFGFQGLFLLILVVISIGVPFLLMSTLARSRIRWSYKYLFG